MTEFPSSSTVHPGRPFTTASAALRAPTTYQYEALQAPMTNQYEAFQAPMTNLSQAIQRSLKPTTQTSQFQGFLLLPRLNPITLSSGPTSRTQEGTPENKPKASSSLLGCEGSSSSLGGSAWFAQVGPSEVPRLTSQALDRNALEHHHQHHNHQFARISDGDNDDVDVDEYEEESASGSQKYCKRKREAMTPANEDTELGDFLELQRVGSQPPLQVGEANAGEDEDEDDSDVESEHSDDDNEDSDDDSVTADEMIDSDSDSDTEAFDEEN